MWYYMFTHVLFLDHLYNVCFIIYILFWNFEILFIFWNFLFLFHMFLCNNKKKLLHFYHFLDEYMHKMTSNTIKFLPIFVDYIKSCNMTCWKITFFNMFNLNNDIMSNTSFFYKEYVGPEAMRRIVYKYLFILLFSFLTLIIFPYFFIFNFNLNFS